MGTSETGKILHELIYPQLTGEVIFADLKPKWTGKVFVAEEPCPGCSEKRHFYFFPNSKFGKCHSGSCEYSRQPLTWWAWVALRYGFKENRDILRKMADLAGVELPSNRRTGGAKKESIQTVKDAMRLIVGMGQLAAKCMPDHFARYLKERRGFDAEMIKKSGLMYMERDPFIKALWNSGASNEILKATGIYTKRFGEDYCLLLPYPDENGEYVGFIGRLNYDLTPDHNELPKYKNAYGTEKDVPYQYHLANKPGNHKMVMVEGPLDAELINHKCKLKGAGSIALCGDQITDIALTKVNTAAAPIIVMALDDDVAGHLSTLHIIRSIKKRIFVVPHFDGYKDPGDLIAAKGPKRFEEILSGAIPASQWVFKYLSATIRQAGPCGRLDIISDLSPIYNNMKDVNDRRQFVEEARAAALLHETDIKAALRAA